MNARQLAVLLTVCSVWGLHFVVIKLAVSAAPPIFYAALRMSLVALLMSPFLRWKRGQMAGVVVAGLCLGGFNYAFLFTGISQATASASAIALELYTPFATILSVVLLKEKVGWRRIAGIALAFAGVAIIALGRHGGGEAGHVGLGVGLVSAAALSEAFGAILVRRTKDVKPYELLAWFAVVGSVALWSATALFEDGQVEALRAENTLMMAGAIIFSAFGASIFGHTAYYWLLQQLPVSQVAPSLLLTTLLAILFSVLLLGEPLTLRLGLGGGIALAGVGIILLRTPKGRIIEPGAPEPVVDAEAVPSGTEQA